MQECAHRPKKKLKHEMCQLNPRCTHLAIEHSPLYGGGLVEKPLPTPPSWWVGGGSTGHRSKTRGQGCAGSPSGGSTTTQEVGRSPPPPHPARKNSSAPSGRRKILTKNWRLQKKWEGVVGVVESPVCGDRWGRPSPGGSTASATPLAVREWDGGQELFL